MVAFAAMRMRREIGAVGLNEQLVHRYAFSDRADALGVFKCDNAGKGDDPAAADQIRCHLGAAAVAVKHTAHFRVFADHIKAVAVRFPVMDDHGETIHLGDAHLHLKVSALCLTVGIVVMIIKADLADGNNLIFLRIIQQIAKRTPCRIDVAFRSGTARMNADGSIHLRISRSLRDTLL